MKLKHQVILASSSPRRSALLRLAGFDFIVRPSSAEELSDQRMEMRELCETNAKLKADAVSRHHPKSIVIGADTLVFHKKTALGKPENRTQAKEMLARLSGNRHHVCTGVCLRLGDKAECFSVVTEVEFKTLTDKIIDDYMRKVNVMDKAGAYAAQEHSEMIIKKLTGDYDNVIGLPVGTLSEKIRVIDSEFC